MSRCDYVNTKPENVCRIFVMLGQALSGNKNELELLKFLDLMKIQKSSSWKILGLPYHVFWKILIDCGSTSSLNGSQSVPSARLLMFHNESVLSGF